MLHSNPLCSAAKILAASTTVSVPNATDIAARGWVRRHNRVSAMTTTTVSATGRQATSSQNTAPRPDHNTPTATSPQPRHTRTLDRLGRSLVHLIDTIRDLQEHGVGFRSLQEQLDTTTSGGKLIFHVFGALAEFERDLVKERTHAGLQAARARGRLFGRPRALSPQQVKHLQSLAKDERNTVTEICETLRISRATFYRYIHEAQPGS